MSASASSGDGRRYARGFGIGALLGALVFVWMITAGTFDLGRRVPFSGNFYDVQAHSLLDGTLRMPASVLQIEGYEHAGNTYMYFGPAPALLRLPTAALTDSLDGRTGSVSMLLAFAVAMLALGRIGWRTRRWARGDAPLGPGEELLAGVSAFVLGTGTTLIFLGVGPYVYHEAILWGVALSFAAFEAILAWIEEPRPMVLLVAAALTLLALLSRFAVGLGPAAALGLLALVVAVARVWPRARGLVPRLGLVDGLGWAVVGWLVAAATVPLGIYAIVNVAKFGTLFSVPYDHQLANAVVPGRKATLAANGGTLVNVEALPTNLLQYLRPDAFRFDSAFPWIRLPTWRPTVIGNLRYDLLDYTSSITASMPVMFVLAIAGLVSMIRSGVRAGRATLSSLGVPVLGAACAVVPSLVFVYITQRYPADFLPLLVLPAFAALHRFVGWAQSGAAKRGAVIAGSVVLGVLALWSCVASISIARGYQDARERIVTFDDTPR